MLALLLTHRRLLVIALAISLMALVAVGCSHNGY